MENLPVNQDCQLSGTKYCRMLNMGNCERCTIRQSEDKESIQQDLELYESLLPTGGVAKLFTDTHCALCKHEPRNERSGYAILDMAHPEPKRVQRWLLGKKVSKFGTMIPVQMSICSKCRRTFLIIEYLPTVLAVVIGLGGLFLLGTGEIADYLTNIFSFLPFVAWLVLAGLGVLIGRLVAKSIAKKANERMYVDALQQPTLAEMVAKGWMPVSNSRVKLLFSKSRIARGLGTAMDAPEDGPKELPQEAPEPMNPPQTGQKG